MTKEGDAINPLWELEKKARDMKEHLLNHFEFQKRIARSSLNHQDMFEADELYNLNLGLDHIEESLPQLIEFYIDAGNEERASHREHGYSLIWNLMAGSFLIGSCGTLSKTSGRVSRSKSAKFAAAHPRNVKWKDAVTAFAAEERQRDPTIYSKKIVELVRQQLNILPTTNDPIIKHIRQQEILGNIAKRAKKS